MRLNRFKNLKTKNRLYFFNHFLEFQIAPIFMIDLRTYGFVLFEDGNKPVKKNIHKYNATIFCDEENLY